MKFTYRIVVFVLASIASYLWIDARTNQNDPIAGYYMPLVKTQDTLKKYVLDDYRLVVAYFYELTDVESNVVVDAEGKETHTDRYEDVDDVYSILEDYAEDHNGRFEDAGLRGVKFVGVNLESGDLNQLKKEYGITGRDALIFFYKGDKQYTQVVYPGFTVAKFIDFLKKAKFEDFLKDEISRQERKEARAERSGRRYYYSYPRVTFGYGNPYYGYYYGDPYYPYYYRRPGFGFGVYW